ncbi:WD repeat-containing protein 35 [Armadillidium vulgare]|nr:WD repeat-containing protein 35 [Armadillidium vulgare]
MYKDFVIIMMQTLRVRTKITEVYNSFLSEGGSRSEVLMGLYDDDGIDMYPVENALNESSGIGGTEPEKQNKMLKINNMIANPWRGAEALHFLLLAQRQLYEGYVDAAMKTCLHLREYEKILPAEDIYSLLCLSSCANRAFATCSKAFIKLESLHDISDEKRESYEDLAMNIFMKYVPKDARSNREECTKCETMIPDWVSVCPSCNNRFSICIVTGRPIMDSSNEWTCSQCQHSALEQDMTMKSNCPLCHAVVND